MKNVFLYVIVAVIVVSVAGFIFLRQNGPVTNGPVPETTVTSTPGQARDSEEELEISVFFGREGEGECEVVFPVARIIPKTQATARVSLEELFKGPTESEEDHGYFTSINPGVEIQTLTIENGVAMADFDRTLEFQVGGSCRVAAIRAQITQTLMQFPSVESVIISIDGRTEDILQP